MKMRFRLSGVVSAAAAVSFISAAQAIDLNWDANNTAAPVRAEGAGQWSLDPANLNWYNAGLGTNVAWTNGNNALFGGNTNAQSTAVPFDIDIASAIVAQDINIAGSVANNGAIAGEVYNLVDVAGGNLTLNGDFIKSSAGGAITVTLANFLTLSAGNHNFVIHDSPGSAAPEIRFLTKITGAGDITINNGANGQGYDAFGITSFNRNNDYTGTTTIQDGYLNVLRGNSLGATSAGTTISGTGTLGFGGGSTAGDLLAFGPITVSEPITITRNTYVATIPGGVALDAERYPHAIRSENGSGTITLNGGMVLDTADARIAAFTSHIIIDSNILNTVGQTGPVLGIGGDTAGDVTLNGINTGLHNGGVALRGGELIVGSDDNLGGTGSPINFLGGSLRINNAFMTDFTNHPLASTTAVNGTLNLPVTGQVFNVSGLSGTGIGSRGLGTLNLNGTNTFTGVSFFDNGVVNVNAATTYSGIRLRSPTLNIVNGAVLTTTGAFISIGADSTGTSGGPDKATVNISGNGKWVAANQDFNISDNANTQGTINLTDTATLQIAGVVFLGKSNNAVATINQGVGTTAAFNRNLQIGTRVGVSPLQQSKYNKAGGALTVVGELWVGNDYNGNGFFQQDAGTTVNNNWLAVGRNTTDMIPGSVAAGGTLNLTGGTFTHNGANNSYVGEGRIVTLNDATHAPGNYVGTSFMNISNNAAFIADVGYFAIGNNNYGNGTLNVQDTGSVKVTLGTFIISQGTGGTGVVNLKNNATVVVNAGETWLGNGSGNGTLNISDNASLTNQNNWIAVGRNGNGVGNLNISGGSLTKAGLGNFTIGSGVSTGTVTQTGGTITSNSTYIGEGGTGLMDLKAGTANLGALAVGRNGPGGELRISGSNVSAGAILMAGVNAASDTTPGTINLSAGSLKATSIAHGIGTGVATVNFTGGTLSAGSYTLAGGVTNNGTGTYAPGGVGATGASALTTGYTQGATGSLAIELAAGSQDSITSTSAVSLNGTLNLSELAGYIPLRYQPVTIISTTGALTGIFSKINGIPVTGATDSRSLAVVYSATGVTVQAALAGDATLDGTVNFDDLVPLAQKYNQTGQTWTSGDFTGDTIVNFDDLVPLAQNYNQSVAVGSLNGLSSEFQADWALAQSLVPEPTSISLLGLGAAALLRRRK